MSSTTPGSGPDDETRPAEPADTSAEEPAEVDEADTDATPAEPEPEPTSDAADGAFDDGVEAPAPVEAEVTEQVAPVEPVEPEATEQLAPVEPGPSGASETSALDAAVLRANAGADTSALDDAERNGIDDAEAAPQPVPAGTVRRETYVPASTAAAAAAAGAATLAHEPPGPGFPLGPQTVYVQAPEPPRGKGNRGFGVLVALIGAVAFAALYAGAAYLLLLSQGDAAAVNTVFVERFLAKPVYWVPIVAFFVGFALLAAIVNRGRWWAYVVFGLLVGVFVYFSYLGGALLTVEAWTLTFEEAQSFIAQRWLDPFAIVAAVIAREIPIWLGGWIAARGRTVTERNRLALEEYDRELAAGPQLQR